MALTKAVVGGDGLATERLYDDTGGLGQTSSNVLSIVASSGVDTRVWKSLAYTILNTHGANAVDWTVFGANTADFSDEVIVQVAATVVPGDADSYALAQAPFAYYRVKIVSTVADSHATCIVRGVQKS